ncbi:MAG: hypothetical protein ABR521_06600 [Gaiellaceae bacterium]
MDAATAGRQEQCTRFADEPYPQPAGLESKPALALKLARVVTEQVAEQSLGHGLG